MKVILRMELKKIFLCFLVLNLALATAERECTVHINTLPERRPFFTKALGSNTVKVGDVLSETITMYNGEKMTGHCATYFNEISKRSHGMYSPHIQIAEATEEDIYVDYNDRQDDYRTTTTTQRTVDIPSNQRRLDFYCRQGSLHIETIQGSTLDLSRLISCQALKWAAYEPKRPLPWCSQESVSYILATKNLEKDVIFGSLCYDLKNMTLESLRYTTYNFSFNQESASSAYPTDVTPHLLKNKIELEEFENHQNYDLATSFSKSLLISAAHYKQDSIIQGQRFPKIFLDYLKILQVHWWTNLYELNWKRFLKAFEERTSQLAYDVYFGVSGKLRYPKMKLCGENETGELEFETYYGNIPAYIWTYMRAIDDSEEFVFISYNSPFYEFLNSTDIIFCEDICNQISWLSKVRSTFPYPSQGVSFCCSAESVRNSTTLNGFPRKYEPSEALFKLTPEEVSEDD